MDTTTIRRGAAAGAAATAFFAVTACGAEIAPPSEDIGSVTHKKAEHPAQPTRTDTARRDFRDEYGAATVRPGSARDDWTGSGNRIDFGD